MSESRGVSKPPFSGIKSSYETETHKIQHWRTGDASKQTQFLPAEFSVNKPQNETVRSHLVMLKLWFVFGLKGEQRRNQTDDDGGDLFSR